MKQISISGKRIRSQLNSWCWKRKSHGHRFDSTVCSHTHAHDFFASDILKAHLWSDYTAFPTGICLSFGRGLRLHPSILCFPYTLHRPMRQYYTTWEKYINVYNWWECSFAFHAQYFITIVKKETPHKPVSMEWRRITPETDSTVMERKNNIVCNATHIMKMDGKVFPAISKGVPYTVLKEYNDLDCWNLLQFATTS